VLERIREYGQIVEFEVTPNPVNIPLLVADLERIATSRGFLFECEGPRLEIRTSGGPLRLALTELVRNAVDHHDRPPGRVQVAWALHGDRVTFTVTDDGPGIARDFRHRIFDLGATLAPRDPRRHAGLGLCIVAHLLTALGQDYGIRPRAQPARGTTVFMTWPVVWSFGGDGVSLSA
jgi:signal transduction histidine kinase